MDEGFVLGLEGLAAGIILITAVVFGVYRTINIVRSIGKETEERVNENTRNVADLRKDFKHEVEKVRMDMNATKEIGSKIDRLFNKVERIEKNQADMRVQMAEEHGNLTEKITKLEATGCKPSKG